MYWPRMSSQIEDYNPQQSKEPIQQCEFAARQWSKVEADLCELKGRILLVVSDYYSNLIVLGFVGLVSMPSVGVFRQSNKAQNN